MNFNGFISTFSLERLGGRLFYFGCCATDRGSDGVVCIPLFEKFKIQLNHRLKK
jgi:hypothetical protein